MPHSLGWSSSRKARRSSQPAEFPYSREAVNSVQAADSGMAYQGNYLGGSPIGSIVSRMIDVMELLRAHAQRSVSLKRRVQAVVGLPYVGSADRRQALAHQLLRKPGIRLDARTAIELIEQLRLHRAAAQRLGVRNLRVEHHHRVARDEAIGEAPLESQGDLPAAQEVGIQHRIAHLAVVLERHLRDGLRVGTAQPLELT